MTCDLCGGKISTVYIDGRTTLGHWGNLCPSCHRTHGCGLGIGKGQKHRLVGGKWIMEKRKQCE